ncbi:DNA cytosine methyltransferase [uncultured Capnocytophaga sp.]|jgi:DNA (cytosine-5)-methyltransferase 1|uniref:DNA cytosine methyltransferase n=1 Tax=uncultured Capnocytophaga sp. TaxID=159273 RepID=UPI0025999101|nr:DNA cytosine methyltransferase [uncultured Capnocytophaga sp.]
MNADDTYIIPKTASTLTGGGHSGGLHSDMMVIRQLPRGKNKGANLTICPTISSNAFQENNLLGGIRRLTEIECERLQGFPDNWTQYGNYNDDIKPIARTQRYKLIGNAVTVDIVELIAKRLKFTTQ